MYRFMTSSLSHSLGHRQRMSLRVMSMPLCMCVTSTSRSSPGPSAARAAASMRADSRSGALSLTDAARIASLRSVSSCRQG